MWRYIWGSFLVWTVLMATKTRTCMNGVSMYVETLHSTVLKSRLYTGCIYMANRADLSPAPFLPAGRAPSVERRSHNPKVPSSILGLRMGSFCLFHNYLHILYIISFQPFAISTIFYTFCTSSAFRNSTTQQGHRGTLHQLGISSLEGCCIMIYQVYGYYFCLRRDAFNLMSMSSHSYMHISIHLTSLCSKSHQLSFPVCTRSAWAWSIMPSPCMRAAWALNDARQIIQD